MTSRRPLLAMVLLAWAMDASAQTSSFVHRLEVTGGVGYFSGAGLGSANANLRANSTGAQPFTLFTTDSTMSGSLAGEARIGWWVSRRVAIEGRLGYSRPNIEASVRADAEGAPPVTVVEGINQFVIDAGVLFRIDEMRIGRVVPYAAGGAGYLRQVHEGLAFIDQGHVYHLGGGVMRDVVTRTRGVIRAAGLRADVRVYLLSGAASLNDRATVHGSYTAGLFVRF
jgi:hypothetical protein